MHETTPLRAGREVALLWAALLSGPVTWAAAFNLDYALVRVACAKDTMLPLHLVTLGALAVVLAGGAVAWTRWRRLDRGEGGAADRARFMAIVALLSSLLFGGLLVAQWIPKLVLHPCMAI